MQWMGLVLGFWRGRRWREKEGGLEPHHKRKTRIRRGKSCKEKHQLPPPHFLKYGGRRTSFQSCCCCCCCDNDNLSISNQSSCPIARSARIPTLTFDLYPLMPLYMSLPRNKSTLGVRSSLCMDKTQNQSNKWLGWLIIQLWDILNEFKWCFNDDDADDVKMQNVSL